MPELTVEERAQAVKLVGRPRGWNRGLLRITPEQVERYHAAGFSYRQIGKLFEVSRTTVLRSIGKAK